MATTTSSSKEYQKMMRELKALRSFVIGMAGKDKEGIYQPKFVQEVLESADEPTTHKFVDPSSFLKQLKNG